MLMWEIRKLYRNPWHVVLIGIVIFFWVVILFFAANTDAERYLDKLHTFWNILGSLITGMAILLIPTKLFIYDKEQHVKEVVLATLNGKRTLFRIRMISALLFTSGFVVTLVILQLALFGLFNPFHYELLDIASGGFIKKTVIAWVGSLLFTLFSALLCTVFQSHTMTMVVGGLLFGLTYIIRGNLVTTYSIAWFLEKGFCSYLIRAKEAIAEPTPYFLAIWYVVLMMLLSLSTFILQTRRHER